MRSSLFSIHLQDQVGEPIDDSGLSGKIGCAVHHAERSQPGRHPVEIPQLTFETTQHCQGNHSCRFIRLLRRYFRSNLTKRTRQRTIWPLRTVPGNESSLTSYSYPRKG